MTNLEQFRIDLLTEDRLQKAFEKTLDEVQVPGCKLVRVNEDHIDTAAEFLVDSFMKNEPMGKSVHAGEEDREGVLEIWKFLLRKNLSLILLDEASGDIIGIRCTSTGSNNDQNEYEHKDTGLRKLITCINYCSKMAKFYDHFGVTEMIRFVALGVNSKYRRRGYASILMKAAIMYVYYLGFESVSIQGEGTSNFSKKVYEANEFEILYESFYDNYKVNNEKVFCNTGEHKSVKVYGKCIRN